MRVSWNVYIDPASQKDLGLLLSLSHRHFNHMVLTFVTQSTLLPSTITHPIALKSLPFFKSRWLTLLPAPWGPSLIPWSQSTAVPQPLASVDISHHTEPREDAGAGSLIP